METPTSLESFCEFVDRQEWEQAMDLVRSHPDIVFARYHLHGWTLLHWLCSMGGTPASLIDLVASLDPTAISVQDTFIGDTALHIVGRNCQLSAEKLLSLLKYSDLPTLRIRNRLGGSALHSVANHNPNLLALEALVEADPEILNVTTHEGIHAVTALWLSFTQTIPGHMLMCSILNGEQIETTPFWDRLWAKVEYLSLQYYWNKHAQRQKASLLSSTDHVALGLLMCNVPLNLFEVCLQYRPSTAHALDVSTGNHPLHLLIENRPYRRKEREAISICIKTWTQAASVSNYNGDIPLQLAIRNKIPWNNGIDLLVNAFPDALQQRDAATSLYFYQLAACQGGYPAIETAFHLLRRRPDILSGKDAS